MTNEEMQRTMQFLLEQQAQFAARMQMDEERIARVESAMIILTELARSADERMDAFQERTDTFDARLNALSETWNEKWLRLAEAQIQSEQHLNALISVVERYLSNRNGNPQG